MAGLSKRSREELYCVQEDCVDVNEISVYLVNNRRECVYVLKGKKLVGVVTIGDYERYFRKDKEELINRSFVCLLENNADDIVDMVATMPNVNSIPIIDDEGHFLYDFRLIRSLEEFLLSRKEKRVYKRLGECGIKRIICINNFEMAKILKLVFDKYDIGDISVECRALYDEDCVDATLYVDNYFERTCAMKAKNVGYQIVNEKSFRNLLLGRYLHLKKYDKFCELIGNTYKRIAIYGENSLMEKFIAGLTKLQIGFDVINKDDIKFDINNRAYFLNSNIKEDYDIIISAGYDMVGWSVIHNKRRVYSLPLPLIEYLALERGKAVYEMDIINNVLPMLQKNGVNVVLWEVPCNVTGIDRVKIKDLLMYGLDRECKEVFGTINNYYMVPFDNKKGYLDYSEVDMEGFNIEKGVRRTIGGMNTASKDIYFHGGCLTFGGLVKDEDTIESYFCKFVHNYNVHNYGLLECSVHYKLRVPEYKKGDIVILSVVYADIYREYGYKVHSVLEAFEEFKDNIGDVAWDIYAHCNGKVNENIAKVLYDICVEENIL